MSKPFPVFLAGVIIVAACGSTTATTSPTTGQTTAPATSLSSTGPGSTDSPAPTGPPTLMTAPGPSRATLINQAIDDGRLDLATGLLYRASSALGLPGVPAEFSAGVPRPDDSIFTEIEQLLPTMSATDQAKLRPFIVRPTDPQSVFAPQPVALLAGAAVPQAAQTSRCSHWADSGPDDPRFKVWACADEDADNAELDIATIVQIFQQVWGPMTKPVPQGMGSPLPDAYAVSNPAAYGGDDRIDVYALDLGQVVYRDGDNEIPADAAAAAVGAPPHPEGGSGSGFMLINRNRLDDSVAMKQDVIHEFFHVLQYAHSVVAPFNGRQTHWFVEASATWAEAHYDREHSDIPEGWFADHFQTSSAGLEDPDVDHQYAAMIWPLFMEQEAGESAIFNAWSAIGGIGTTDFRAVTQAISDQLAIPDNFHDFALRNLDIGEVLAAAGVTRYRSLDPRFPEPVPPVLHSKLVNPGDPLVSADPIPPLGAAYFQVAIGPSAREVTVSLANLLPSDNVEATLLIQYQNAGQWTKESLAGGAKRRFCRDDENVQRLYVVVSNRSLTDAVGGTTEISAKESCEQQIRLTGSVSWDFTITEPPGPTATISESDKGNAQIDVLWDATTGFSFQGDSTFSVHSEISNCSPAGDAAGVIESFTEPTEPSEGIAIGTLQGAPGQDLEFGLHIDNHWMALCQPAPDPPVPGPIYANYEFPFCSPIGVAALYDGQSTYVFRCEYDGGPYGIDETATGTMSGTLTVAQRETSAP